MMNQGDKSKKNLWEPLDSHEQLSEMKLTNNEDNLGEHDAFGSIDEYNIDSDF